MSIDINCYMCTTCKKYVNHNLLNTSCDELYTCICISKCEQCNTQDYVFNLVTEVYKYNEYELKWTGEYQLVCYDCAKD